MRLIAVKLSDEFMQMILEASAQLNISRSQLIRDALTFYLSVLKKGGSKGDHNNNLKIIC